MGLQLLEGKITIRPHHGQYPLFQTKAAFPAAIAGTGSGKTVVGMGFIPIREIQIIMPGADDEPDQDQEFMTFG